MRITYCRPENINESLSTLIAPPVIHKSNKLTTDAIIECHSLISSTFSSKCLQGKALMHSIKAFYFV